MGANPFPLNIGVKQDSWDKLQLLQHLDPSLKLYADELNKMVAALNYLYGNITVGEYSGNLPLSLQPLILDHSAEGSTQEKAQLAINAMPRYVLQPGYAQWFYTERIVLSNGGGISATDVSPRYAVITEYFLLRKKIAPTDGESAIGAGGTPIDVADLIALPAKDTRNFAPQEFNLGNIGTATIQSAASTTGPRSTPNAASIIFRGIQDGEARVWLYLGAQENVGIGYPAVGASAFRLFPADSADADPLPPTSQDNIVKTLNILDTNLSTLDAAGLAAYFNLLVPGIEKEAFESWRTHIVDAAGNILKTFDLVNRGKGPVGLEAVTYDVAYTLTADMFYEINPKFEDRIKTQSFTYNGTENTFVLANIAAKVLMVSIDTGLYWEQVPSGEVSGVTVDSNLLYSGVIVTIQYIKK